MNEPLLRIGELTIGIMAGTLLFAGIISVLFWMNRTIRRQIKTKKNTREIRHVEEQGELEDPYYPDEDAKKHIEEEKIRRMF